MSASRLSDPSSYDVVVFGGGGGGSSFVASARAAGYSGSMLVVCSSADDGGHSGVLRTTYEHEKQPIVPPGDIVKVIGAGARVSSHDSQALRSRDARGRSVGNTLFEQAYVAALEARSQSPNTDAVRQLLDDATCAVDVCPVTPVPTDLQVSWGQGLTVRGEDVISETEFLQSHYAAMKLEVFRTDSRYTSAQASSFVMDAVRDCRQIVIAPSNPIISIGAALRPVQNSAPRYDLDMSTVAQKTIVVLGSQNPHHMSGAQVADHLAIIERSFGARIPTVAYAKTSKIPCGTDDLRDRNVIELPGVVSSRSADKNDPLSAHKPSVSHHPDFARQVLDASPPQQ